MPDWLAMRLSHATYIDRATWRVVMEPKALVANVYLDWGPELPAAATVSGDPLPMSLWLWGRGLSDSLTVGGEAAGVDHLGARLVAATQ